jgi:enoyl-CoA hydratase
MPYRTLTLETNGPIAYLRLVRPDDGNPIDAAFLRELDDACATISDSPDIRVAVLAAEGDVFSKGWGADAPSLAQLRESPPFGCLESMGQPVICGLHRDAVSAGLELALACDVRLAVEGAHFSLPDVGEGRLPMGGGTQRLSRLVGRGEAMRLILLGEQIDAVEALRLGLVSGVYSTPADLVTQTEALATRMASRGPLALRYAKEAVRRGLEQPLDQSLRYETDLTVILQTTDDRSEGVNAFLEKREPEFKGN